MNEGNKNVEEINLIDEYLNNYKEQKLVEFCVQKDKHIENLRKENHEYAEKLTEMKERVEKSERTFGNLKELYTFIKTMPVEEYLKLYHMISSDVSGCITTIGVINTSNSMNIRGY